MTEVAASEREVELLLPEHDVERPELSIVIPALDEGLTITDFVRWCHRGWRPPAWSARS